MKNLLFILSAVIFVVACQPKDNETEKSAMLAEKKASVSKKKDEIKALQAEIEVLNKENRRFRTKERKTGDIDHNSNHRKIRLHEVH